MLPVLEWLLLLHRMWPCSICALYRSAICRSMALVFMNWMVLCTARGTSLHTAACRVPLAVSWSLVGVWRRSTRSTTRIILSARSVCSRWTGARSKSRARSRIATCASRNFLVNCRWLAALYCKHCALYHFVCFMFLCVRTGVDKLCPQATSGPSTHFNQLMKLRELV